jgi:hypothetical protein
MPPPVAAPPPLLAQTHAAKVPFVLHTWLPEHAFAPTHATD